VKHFNIDEYVPTYDPPFKLWRKATGADKIQYMKACRVHTTVHSHRCTISPPGADPKKVLDWRALERRSSQLWVQWLDANNKFWDAIRSARRERGLTRNQDLYIFVEPQWVLQCHEDGFSHQDAVYITNELLAGKRSNQEFAVMRLEEGGREIGVLNRKANFLQKCAGVYERILERALRDRLQLYLDSIRDVQASRSYFPPQIYIIENEGRARVAHSDSLGRLTWMNGDVLCTSKGVGCEV
jgi:hypothetical protein